MLVQGPGLVVQLKDPSPRSWSGVSLRTLLVLGTDIPGSVSHIAECGGARAGRGSERLIVRD